LIRVPDAGRGEIGLNFYLERIRMRRPSLVAGTLFLAACLGTTDNTTIADNNPSDPATETFASNLDINISQMTKTDLGDYYKDLKVGTGAQLDGPKIVVFGYETFLKTGVLIDQQIGLQRDLSTVVRGLQDGMVGMREGGERVIVVPSALAFGPFAKPPIPANATLVFDVILNTIP
jgi:FKBP-type peptidyl-prolyl cis-trans isomerase